MTVLHPKRKEKNLTLKVFLPTVTTAQHVEKEKKKLAQMDSAQQPEPFWTDANIGKLTPEFFAHLQTLDAIGILLELKRLGFLDAILRGDTPQQLDPETTRAFLAIQVVCRYISQTIRALSSREQNLQTALLEANQHIQQNHARFALIKRERNMLSMETQRIEEEIQHCDRILKSNAHDEQDEDDSPWEDHNHYEPTVNHLRVVAPATAFSSMLMASPMNINHAFNNSFFHHSLDASSVASPKFGATPRSRAGSETSTQGGMMSEDELVLFRTIGTTGNNAWEKVTNAAAAAHNRQKSSSASRMENRINEVPIEEEEEE